MEETQVVDDPRAHRFEILLGGELAGFAEYQRGSATVSFLHTEIDPRFEGRGLGSILIRGALDASCAAGLSVLPYCPFVLAFIQRHPEYLDLVPPHRRARFGLASPEAEPTA